MQYKIKKILSRRYTYIYDKLEELSIAITEEIHNGSKITENTINAFVDAYISVHYNYKDTNNIENVDKTLEILILSNTPSESILEKLLNGHIYFPLLKLLDNDFNFSRNFVNKIYCATLVGSNTEQLNKYRNLVIRFSNKYFPTEYELEKMSSSLTNILIPELYITSINNNIKLTQKTLYNIIMRVDNNTILDDMIINNTNIEKTQYLLEAACKTNNEHKIKKFLDCNLIPTNKCFTNILETYFQASEKSKIIDLIIAYGYHITYDDVINAIPWYVAINDVHIYGLKFDDRYYEQCKKYNFYPYKFVMDMCLEIACKNTISINGIKNLVKEGAKPTIKAMQNICENKYIANKKPIIEYFMLFGVIPDPKCFEELRRSNNITLDNFVELYNKSLHNAQIRKSKL